MNDILLNLNRNAVWLESIRIFLTWQSDSLITFPIIKYLHFSSLKEDEVRRKHYDHWQNWKLERRTVLRTKEIKAEVTLIARQCFY